MSTLSVFDLDVAFCELCDNLVPIETVGNTYPVNVCAYCGEEL